MKIYIDRLRGGEIEKIELTLTPELLEIEEKELIFSNKIQITGEAYLTDEHLLIHLEAETSVRVPCAICNQLIEAPLIIKDFTHTENISEIRLSIYEALPLFREALLLHIPLFVECSQGSCPERKVVGKYLKAKPAPSHFPFADL